MSQDKASHDAIVASVRKADLGIQDIIVKELTEQSLPQDIPLQLRRRYIEEIKSPIYAVREFGKRTAMNAPIQGSAADIIKIAMIDLHRYIETNKLKSRLLLQVHDELILEVPETEMTLMNQIVPEVMSKAVKLKVKLETSCDTGENWFMLK